MKPDQLQKQKYQLDHWVEQEITPGKWCHQFYSGGKNIEAVSQVKMELNSYGKCV